MIFGDFRQWAWPDFAVYKRDWLYLFALWCIAFIPLVGLRTVFFPGRFFFNACMAAAGLFVAALWCREGTSADTSVSQLQAREAMSAKEAVIAGLWMALLTYWQFHLPMLEHWWSATDETLTMAIRDIWYQTWDDMHARPLAGLPFALASWITPDSFQGYLLLNSFFRLGTAFFLYATFRVIYPSSCLPAASAAALFIVSPTESIRYLSTALCYYSPLFFMVLACWLFLWSYQRGSLPGLLASLASIGATLLQYESPMLFFGILPLLLWVDKRPWKWVWLVSWYAACLLFGLRLLHHFFFDAYVYQSAIIGHRESDLGAWVARIVKNELMLMGTVSRYVEVTAKDVAKYGVPAALAAVLAIVPFLKRGEKLGISGRISWRHLAWSLAALSLVVLPHAPLHPGMIEDFITDRTMRLGMFTSVIQAVTIIVALLLLAKQCSFSGKVMLACGTGVLFFFAAVHNQAFQAHGGNWNRYVSFEKTASLYRSLAEKMPKEHGANAFFVILPEDQPSQFGWGYSLYHGGCSLFGMPGFQGRQLPDGRLEQRVTTGYVGAYAPMPECQYIVFKVDEKQESVDIVSVPPANSNSYKGPCQRCYTDIVLTKEHTAPYFMKIKCSKL